MTTQSKKPPRMSTLPDVLDRVLAAPYARTLLKDPDGYGAQVLEFPGCYSAGATAREAIDNLDAAIALWVGAALAQGQSIPEPFATAEYSGRVTLRLPPDTHRRAVQAAALQGISLNRWLSDAIARATGELAATAVPAATERGVLRRVAENSPAGAYGLP